MPSQRLLFQTGIYRGKSRQGRGGLLFSLIIVIVIIIGSFLRLFNLELL